MFYAYKKLKYYGLRSEISTENFFRCLERGKPDLALREDCCNGITFRYLQPSMAYPENLRLPVSREFAHVKFPEEDEQIKRLLLEIAEMPRMSSIAIGGIIHWLVRHMSTDCRYLNVGVWRGFTLFAGMVGNPDKIGVGVDNFTQFGGLRMTF